MEKIFFFANQLEFREWLKENHDTTDELWVGYYKKSSGRESMTWPESVDQAICYGWIDGIRKSINDISYKIRFTPRRPGSIWSAVNIKKVEELKKQGLITASGLAAYDKKTVKKSITYAYEQKNVQLSKKFEQKIKENKKAWLFFQALAPSYKKASIWWVMSAKKEETRLRRLAVLIDCSEKKHQNTILKPTLTSI